MSCPGGAATSGLPSGIPGSQAGKRGMGKDGSGVPKVTQQGHTSTEGVCAPAHGPLAWSTIPCTPHTPWRVPTTQPFPALSLWKARCCLLHLGRETKAPWGRAVPTGLRNLAQIELHLFLFILLCSMRLT